MWFARVKIISRQLATFVTPVTFIYMVQGDTLLPPPPTRAAKPPKRYAESYAVHRE